MKFPASFPAPGLLPAAVLTAGLLVSSVPAAAVYSKGHGDLGIAYEDGVFEPHWHLHSGAVVDGTPLAEDGEFAPHEMQALVPDPSIARPSGSAWDFLGVTAGASVWFLPQGEDVNKPFLGIASEELEPAEWTSLTLSLVGVSGPAGGELSLWENDFAGPAVKLATSDGIGAADSFSLIVGSHAHYTGASPRRACTRSRCAGTASTRWTAP